MSRQEQRPKRFRGINIELQSLPSHISPTNPRKIISLRKTPSITKQSNTLHPRTIIMPKSKRAKVVHTSKVEKKGKELTLRLYANIQECVAKYAYIYVFSVENMRNTYLKDVRTQLSDSRYITLSLPARYSNTK